MRGIPRRETVERIGAEYPAGTRVELVSMTDPYTDLKPGEKGTVICVDSMATIHVRWDCGPTLGLVYGEDCCRMIKG